MEIFEFGKTAGGELTKLEKYALTKDPAIQKVSDHAGETYQVKSWIHYSDTNADGLDVDVLTFSDGITALGTNSRTFIRDFLDIVDLAEGSPFTVEICKGTTKNNRTYFSCRCVDIDG